MSYSGVVNGVELTVTKEWSRRPRVTHQGRELTQDSWGNYQFHDENGQPAQLRVAYQWWELRPKLQIGSQTVFLGRSIPTWVRVAFLAFIGLAVVAGGGLGSGLALLSTWGSLTLLRQEDRRARHVLGAILLPLLAVMVWGVANALLRSTLSRTR
ncbi:hypothetical protein [Microlunatus antarcticus]|uniref:Uncharacterized protein n=1 Tax=Microlunatus antarcticus TaxID=53388 RepID=A0A7W5JV84_9ACTN|nr:hypothetical protein [Microlunatus antarcticus]MBB3326402.1 hypothetical protein [Microlunatus antarcticus]